MTTKLRIAALGLIFLLPGIPRADTPVVNRYVPAEKLPWYQEAPNVPVKLAPLWDERPSAPIERSWSRSASHTFGG